MLFALLALLLQTPTPRAILEAEDARVEQPDVLIQAVKSADTTIQRLGVRAIGRLERPALADSVRPLTTSPDARVRMEAINALGQMNVGFDFATLLKTETDPAVQIGRAHV